MPGFPYVGFGFDGSGVEAEVEVEVVRWGFDGNVGSFERVMEAQRSENEALVVRKLIVVGF